jgi:hypothetical protein
VVDELVADKDVPAMRTLEVDELVADKDVPAMRTLDYSREIA